jgi:AcrR family transcriptional regulator
MARHTPKSAGQRKSDEAAPDIRERILDRTIFLMGKEGTTEVSVRAIAREAGVNVAAVNYYFTSKEQMLAEMAKRFERGFDEVMELLDASNLPAEQRLRRWAAEVMRYLAEYPGVLTLMERQMAADDPNPFGAALRSTMELAVGRLRSTLREIVGGADEQRLSFKLTLLISALAGPFPRHHERAPGAHSSAERAGFLDLLLEHLRH